MTIGSFVTSENNNDVFYSNGGILNTKELFSDVVFTPVVAAIEKATELTYRVFVTVSSNSIALTKLKSSLLTVKINENRLITIDVYFPVTRKIFEILRIVEKENGNININYENYFSISGLTNIIFNSFRGSRNWSGKLTAELQLHQKQTILNIELLPASFKSNSLYRGFLAPKIETGDYVFENEKKYIVERVTQSISPDIFQMSLKISDI